MKYVHMALGIFIGCFWMKMIDVHYLWVGTFITLLAVGLIKIVTVYIGEWLNGGFDSGTVYSGTLLKANEVTKNGNVYPPQTLQQMHEQLNGNNGKEGRK